jgi:hypothetical protein
MCRSPCETVDAADAEFLGLGPHVNARQGAEGRALRVEAVAATCLGKRPDRVALTRSPSRLRMTAFCAQQTARADVEDCDRGHAVWWDCRANEGLSCVSTADDADGPGVGADAALPNAFVDGAGLMRPSSGLVPGHAARGPRIRRACFMPRAVRGEMNSLGPTRQSRMTERTSAHKAGRDLAMLGLAIVESGRSSA